MIDGFTFDGTGAGMRVYEDGRPAWYSIDSASVRAVLWRQWRKQLHSSAVVEQVVQVLTDRASRAVRAA